MYIRWSGFLIVPFWLVVMGWLFAHEVYPALTARDAPTMQIGGQHRNENSRVQFAILDASDRKLGDIWSLTLAGESAVRREDYVWLEQLPIPIAPVRIRVESSFTAAGLLDEFTVTADSPDASARLHGERFYAAFSFTLDGLFNDRRVTNNFKIPLSDGESLSASLHPFTPLTGLQVGRSWRMQVLNPLNAITGLGAKFDSVLVTVTDRQTIATPTGNTECFVLHAPRTRVWIDDAGVVQAQEVELPVLGRFRVVRRADFDERTLAANRQLALNNRREPRR